jgi:signal transduction histidine kinase
VKRGQCVECVVSDSGKGIDQKFLPFVFDRFRQENRSQQSSTTGLGLGLTIVREIAELHGGRVTAQSAGPNQGATFTVQLPIRLRRRM